MAQLKASLATLEVDYRKRIDKLQVSKDLALKNSEKRHKRQVEALDLELRAKDLEIERLKS